MIGFITFAGEEIAMNDPVKILVVETTVKDPSLTEKSMIYMKVSSVTFSTSVYCSFSSSLFFISLC
jgi:hypothetical protein